jgi:hypothetical protein
MTWDTYGEYVSWQNSVKLATAGNDYGPQFGPAEPPSYYWIPERETEDWPDTTWMDCLSLLGGGPSRRSFAGGGLGVDDLAAEHGLHHPHRDVVARQGAVGAVFAVRDEVIATAGAERAGAHWSYPSATLRSASSSRRSRSPAAK